MSVDTEIVRFFTQFHEQCVEINDYSIKQMLFAFNEATRIRIIEENKLTMPLPIAIEPHEEELSGIFETFMWALCRNFDTSNHVLQHTTIKVMLSKFTHSTRKRIHNSVFAQEIHCTHEQTWNLH